MPARMVVELPDGRKVLFGGRGSAKGLSEVGVAEKVAKATADQFKAGLGTLAGLIATLEQSIGRMSPRPDKVEVELRASLSGDCDLWIVSGEGEAEFKVTVTWGEASHSPASEQSATPRAETSSAADAPRHHTLQKS